MKMSAVREGRFLGKKSMAGNDAMSTGEANPISDSETDFANAKASNLYHISVPP